MHRVTWDTPHKPIELTDPAVTVSGWPFQAIRLVFELAYGGPATPN